MSRGPVPASGSRSQQSPSSDLLRSVLYGHRAQRWSPAPWDETAAGIRGMGALGELAEQGICGHCTLARARRASLALAWGMGEACVTWFGVAGMWGAA